MAGNLGHPFYGNQYTTGNYLGNYHYKWLPNTNPITQVAKKSVEEMSSNLISVSSATMPIQQAGTITTRGLTLSRINSNTVKTLVVISTITAVGFGSYFLYKHFKKDKEYLEENRHQIPVTVNAF